MTMNIVVITTNSTSTCTRLGFVQALVVLVTLIGHSVNGQQQRIVASTTGLRQQQQQQQGERLLIDFGFGIFGTTPCDNICPNDNDIINSPDSVIPSGTLSIDLITNDITCSELVTLGKNSTFNRRQCTYLRSVISPVASICSCTAPPITITDTSSPTVTPIITPTASPSIQVPTSPITNASPPTTTPTSAVTTSPTAVESTTAPTISGPIPNSFNVATTSDVLLRLESVPSTLDTPELVSSFEIVLETLLKDSMLSTLSDKNVIAISSVNVTIANQRNNQESSSNDISTKITGQVVTNGSRSSVISSEVWTNAAIQVVNNNQATIVASLKTSDPTYYSTIASLTAALDDEGGAVVPTKSPTSTTPTRLGAYGLTGGAISGIILFAVVFIAFCIRGYCVLQSWRKTNNPSNDDESVKQEYFEKDDDAETIRQLSFVARVDDQQDTKSKISDITTYIGQTSSPQHKKSPMPTYDRTGLKNDPPGVIQFSKQEQQQQPPPPQQQHKTTTNNFVPPDSGNMMVEKTIAVPAGKLRLQIETNTELGPTVSEVQSDSPLVGQVLVGDIILSINSTDTRSMTGLAVASLFVDTASEKDRTMVILRHSSRNVSTSDVVTSTTVNKSVLLQEATLTVPKSTPRSPNSDVVAEQKSKTFGEEKVSYDDNGMVEINIIAPPGRLGLFFETTKDGLQIVKIRPESPLHGKVRVGDIMLSVNGIYCRTMTSLKMTQLLIDTQANERTISLLTHTSSHRNDVITTTTTDVIKTTSGNEIKHKLHFNEEDEDDVEINVLAEEDVEYKEIEIQFPPEIEEEEEEIQLPLDTDEGEENGRN